jgi:hypothetical protein
MAVFELVTVDGRTIHFQHDAASIAAFLRVLVANRFVVGEQVGPAKGQVAGQTVPIGITFHSIAQVRLQSEPGENRNRELIEHHALSDYRERG